jgi:hypothetical protein
MIHCTQCNFNYDSRYPRERIVQSRATEGRDNINCSERRRIFGGLKGYVKTQKSEYLHRSPASRRRGRKGNPVPGGLTGPTYSWGIKIRVPGPPGWGSLEYETVKYGQESHGTRTR